MLGTYLNPSGQKAGKGHRPVSVKDMNRLAAVFNNMNVDQFQSTNDLLGVSFQTYPDFHSFYTQVDGSVSSAGKRAEVGIERENSEYPSQDLIILFKDGVSKVLIKPDIESGANLEATADGYIIYEIDISDFSTITEVDAVAKFATTILPSTLTTIFYPIARVKWNATKSIIKSVEPMQYENIILTIPSSEDSCKITISPLDNTCDHAEVKLLGGEHITAIKAPGGAGNQTLTFNHDDPGPEVLTVKWLEGIDGKDPSEYLEVSLGIDAKGHIVVIKGEMP